MRRIDLYILEKIYAMYINILENRQIDRINHLHD